MHVAQYDRVVSTNDDVYLRVAERFGEVLSRVADNQWDDPTPCVEWTVHGLGAHVIATHRRVYALVDPEGLAAIDEEAPLVDQWNVVATTMRRALSSGRSPGRSSPVETVTSPFRSWLVACSCLTLCATPGTSPTPPVTTRRSTSKPWR